MSKVSKFPVRINGEVKIISIEEAILWFLDKKTPPAITSQDVADGLSSPYPTIHPKLKILHEQGLIEGRQDQTPRPGKKRLLWAKKGDLDTILQRWKEMVPSE
jgi:DNA-binding PadR family transcriptional regulator